MDSLNHFYLFLKIKDVLNISLEMKINLKIKNQKFYIFLEKDDNLGFNLSTHGDIEEISFLDYEKEVLFFLFHHLKLKK